ncbi:MAG: signal peptidase I [Patescibacteria group bacterium]
MKRASSYFWEILRFAVVTVLIVVPVRAYVAQPFVVSGVSMAPSFENGEYLIIDELSYLLRHPTRGEVIVFRYPRNPSKFFIKRVIGLPGETVTISDGEVHIKSGQTETTWSYPDIPTEATDSRNVYTLGPGQYFVLGDNRSMSLDSRAWGSVDRELIKGRVLVRLFPFDRISFLPASPSASDRSSRDGSQGGPASPKLQRGEPATAS